MGHTLSDNRHGLIANAMVSIANGHAEREAAKVMINAASEVADDDTINITLGADKGYDAQEFIQACQDMDVIPHVAQNTSGCCSAVPDAIAASEGYALSQCKRKLIEQGFGWAKTVWRIRQVMVRGLKRVDHLFVLTMTVFNAHALAGANPRANAMRHRYLIQKRLKLPGAWWRAANAENILALRVNRTNGE